MKYLQQSIKKKRTEGQYRSRRGEDAYWKRKKIIEELKKNKSPARDEVTADIFKYEGLVDLKLLKEVWNKNT